MPVLPSSLLEPIWVEFAALVPARGAFDPAHPLRCHRRRIPDRVVFEHLVEALVHGAGYERVASPGCSDATIRRRLQVRAAAGLRTASTTPEAATGGTPNPQHDASNSH